MGIKDKMMEQMMNKFFANMKPEEKQKMMTEMMEKFLGNMTAEEKQAMMKEMMPQMMGPMMGGGSGSPMMNMMGMMSSMMGKGTNSEGGGESPWDMCKKMMSSIGKANELATYATPEIRGLFEEWATQIEDEILKYVQESKTDDVDKIAEHFKLSRNSITYFLTRLANKGKINLKAQKAE